MTSKVRKAGELMETGQAVATSKGDDAAGDLQQMFLAMTEEVGPSPVWVFTGADES